MGFRNLTALGKVRNFLKRVGMQAGDMALLDIADAVNTLMATEAVAFDVALWRYWERHHQAAISQEPLYCQQAACGQAFLSWSGRRYRYCSRRCKVIAQNARWYAAHREAMITRAIRYRRWSQQ